MLDVRTVEGNVFHFTLTELELHSILCWNHSLSLSLSWPINIPCSPNSPGHLVFRLSWPYLQTACLQEGHLFSELVGGASQQWSKEHESVQCWISVRSYSVAFFYTFFFHLSFCGVQFLYSLIALNLVMPWIILRLFIRMVQNTVICLHWRQNCMSFQTSQVTFIHIALYNMDCFKAALE